MHHGNLRNPYYVKVHTELQCNHTQEIYQTSAVTAQKPALIVTLDRDYAYHKSELFCSLP